MQIHQLIIDVYNVQLSNQPSERLAQRLITSSNGAFAQCVFVSGGSEAMEASIKLARQYFWEIKQPQRKFFVARHLSYHGNTLGALALSNHPARRAPYEVLLNQDAFHHVSPVYYKRFAKEGESEDAYVARLAQEVEDKFQELGPENVIACEYGRLLLHFDSRLRSRGGTGRWSYSGCHLCSQGILCRH